MYVRIIALEESKADPPPKAIMVSGLNARISEILFEILSTVGFGTTPEKILVSTVP